MVASDKFVRGLLSIPRNGDILSFSCSRVFEAVRLLVFPNEGEEEDFVVSLSVFFTFGLLVLFLSFTMDEGVDFTILSDLNVTFCFGFDTDEDKDLVMFF